ncbi:MAG TPA: nuclear transport factor 2 family protein [Candidatus Acidoferrales bacterium]
MKIAARACFAIIAVSLLLPAQERDNLSADQSLILTLERAWNVAEEHKDVRALDQLLSSTLAYTDYDGSFMNKTQFLASVKTAGLDADQITNETASVQVYGASAIVTGIYHEKGVLKGKAISRRGRFTDTWVKENGSWMCVASQSTLISHPPE